jgi:hypothetical protein
MGKQFRSYFTYGEELCRSRARRRDGAKLGNGELPGGEDSSSIASPIEIGAMQSPQRKTVGIEPAGSEGEDLLKWHSSAFTRPKSTSELAAWIIKELANFADEEESRIVL